MFLRKPTIAALQGPVNTPARGPVNYYHEAVRPPRERPLIGPPEALALLALGLACVHLARWPIVATDSDVWLHLGLGRYIREHHALPRDSFFSFLSPTRYWVDYYWLFQVLVDRIHAWLGYRGLVALRAILYAGTSGLAALFLLGRRESAPAAAWSRAALAALFAALLLPRYTLVRPHIFGYLFIAAFLYVLERRRELLWALPPLAVLWCNLHGISYPFLWLVVGSYLIEGALAARRGGPAERRAFRALLGPGGLCLAAALATPFGWRLLRVPFMSLGYAALATKELQPFPAGSLLTLGAGNGWPNFTTLFALLLAAAIAAALRSWRRGPRIAPLLLFAGGLITLAKGQRFAYECSLLALPLLASAEIPPRKACSAAAAAILALSFVFIEKTFALHPRFPLSRNGVPAGVAAFLEKVDAGGRVLNYPDTGSYLWYRLYPRYRVYIDMCIPTLFAPEDLESVRRTYAESAALARTLESYRPDFVSVPLRFGWLQERMAAHPEYALVFFDDVEALYADRTRQPSVAASYALKGLDPFALRSSGAVSLPRDGRELARMLDIDPGGQTTNQLAALVYLERGEPARALPHAEAILREYPEWPVGRDLLARVRADMAK